MREAQGSKKNLCREIPVQFLGENHFENKFAALYFGLLTFSLYWTQNQSDY